MNEELVTYGMAIARKKTTIYLDPELHRAAKVLAASTGRREYEVLEDALRQYLHGSTSNSSRQALRGLLDRFAGRSDVGDDDAMSLAYAELHQARHDRRGKR
jgi:predicted transcriptional regulator